jgi:hypothetical protein
VRILIDEGVPMQICRALTGHTSITVQQAGWSSFLNGDLLARAEGEFDLFITADKNLKYQQNLTGRSLAIVELSTNKRRIVEQNFDRIQEAIEGVTLGAFISLELK